MTTAPGCGVAMAIVFDILVRDEGGPFAEQVIALVPFFKMYALTLWGGLRRRKLAVVESHASGTGVPRRTKAIGVMPEFRGTCRSSLPLRCSLSGYGWMTIRFTLLSIGIRHGFCLSWPMLTLNGLTGLMATAAAAFSLVAPYGGLGRASLLPTPSVHIGELAGGDGWASAGACLAPRGIRTRLCSGSRREGAGPPVAAADRFVVLCP